MSNTAINTAQNVNINYKYAGLGQRIVALLIDGVVIFIYYIIISLTIFKGADYIDPNGIIGIVQLALIPPMFYSLLQHIIFSGRTVGKFIMGIRVIKEDGSPATWSDYIVRWMMRLIDFYLFMFTVGTISVLLSKKAQRLGDIAARTIVINTRKTTKISHTILEELDEHYLPKFQSVLNLDDATVNEIKDIYRLAGANRDYRTLHELRHKVEYLLGTQSDMRDGVYVRTVLKDYTYLTQST